MYYNYAHVYLLAVCSIIQVSKCQKVDSVHRDIVFSGRNASSLSQMS